MAKSDVDFKDVNLVCKECGNSFLFTAKEQKFYVKQGFEHVPTRCNDCRLAARDRRDRGQQYTAIKCKITNKVGRVPFVPDNPDDAYTAEAFEVEFAKKGRYVDPLGEPDHTDVIEEERLKRAAQAEQAEATPLEQLEPAVSPALNGPAVPPPSL